jgi:hypothetical protein
MPPRERRRCRDRTLVPASVPTGVRPAARASSGQLAASTNGAPP